MSDMKLEHAAMIHNRQRALKKPKRPLPLNAKHAIAPMSR